MRFDIIITGPYGIGKSTVARLVADRLGWQCCSLDDIDVYWGYLKEMDDFNSDIEDNIKKLDMHSPEWQPYHAWVIESCLTRYSPNQNCVYDLGGTYTVFSDKQIAKQVEQVLSLYPNRVLLLPAQDADESLKFLLKHRKRKPTACFISEERLTAIHNYVLSSETIYSLTTVVIFTKGKSPKDICHEILSHIQVTV
jgi:adenylate kinase family enzyme